jgi:hypothetical protein
MDRSASFWIGGMRIPPHWLFWMVDQWPGCFAALLGAGLLFHAWQNAGSPSPVEDPLDAECCAAGLQNFN